MALFAGFCQPLQMNLLILMMLLMIQIGKRLWIHNMMLLSRIEPGIWFHSDRAPMSLIDVGFTRLNENQMDLLIDIRRG
jgi:hypothetical protein